MSDHLTRRLEEVARALGAGGSHEVAPPRGQSLDDFQPDVYRLRAYAAVGLLHILEEREVEVAGGRQVGAVMVALTDEGAAEWGGGSVEPRPEGEGRREERREAVSEFDKVMRNIEDPQGDGPWKSGWLKEPSDEGAVVRRIVVDKRTHRVRLENETESEMTIVIEEKGGEK